MVAGVIGRGACRAAAVRVEIKGVIGVIEAEVRGQCGGGVAGDIVAEVVRPGRDFPLEEVGEAVAVRVAQGREGIGVVLEVEHIVVRDVLVGAGVGFVAVEERADAVPGAVVVALGEVGADREERVIGERGPVFVFEGRIGRLRPCQRSAIAAWAVPPVGVQSTSGWRSTYWMRWNSAASGMPLA